MVVAEVFDAVVELAEANDVNSSCGKDIICTIGCRNK